MYDWSTPFGPDSESERFAAKNKKKYKIQNI
jgi:hypothetical protein